MRKRTSIEAAKYGLRASRKPQEGSVLAGRVLVDGPPKPRTANIVFAQDLVVYLGGVMPQGLAEFCPGYLAFRYYKKRSTWVLFCCYLDNTVCMEVARYAELPEWVGKERRNHGKDKQSA